MISAKVLAACLMLSAQQYDVPPAVLIGLMHVEGGRVGQQVGPNSNNTYDLGPMQVNTHWIPELAKAWKIDTKTAHRLVRDDGCVNVRVAAWILKNKINRAGSLLGGIAYYHSATPKRGAAYAAKVLRVMEKKGLIRRSAQEQSATSGKRGDSVTETTYIAER
ncbi:MAG: lytic transglycosylase domain-containing protein [Bdellovibrionales bacterium]